jgi:hypothetical protein
LRRIYETNVFGVLTVTKSTRSRPACAEPTSTPPPPPATATRPRPRPPRSGVIICDLFIGDVLHARLKMVEDVAGPIPESRLPEESESGV